MARSLLFIGSKGRTDLITGTARRMEWTGQADRTTDRCSRGHQAAHWHEGVTLMESSILCGERETFAVEFAKAASPHYIHVRLWIAGHWVGDFNDSLMPEFMCARLLELACPLRYRKYVYDSEGDVPTYDELLDRGGWSFGESFDPFALTYFSVRTSNRIHFKWRLHEAYYPLFPDTLNRTTITRLPCLTIALL